MEGLVIKIAVPCPSFSTLVFISQRQPVFQLFLVLLVFLSHCMIMCSLVNHIQTCSINFLLGKSLVKLNHSFTIFVPYNDSSY